MNKKKKAPSQKRAVKKVVKEVPAQREERQLVSFLPVQTAPVTEKDVVSYMDAFNIAGQLAPNEKRQFVEVAVAYGLNPFKREIYCVPYGKEKERKLSIITGYEVYIKRAERSGKLSGWEVRTEGTGQTMKAVITIWRKDWSHPFTHEAFFSECVQTKYDGTPTHFWKKMPALMLKKVCISQGFRLAFPDELGGMPYTADELPEDMATPMVPSSPPRATASEVNAAQEIGENHFKKKEIDEKIERDVTPVKDEEPPSEEATARVQKVVEAFSWVGKIKEYQWVSGMIKKGVNDTQADTIIDHVMALNLPPRVAEQKPEIF